MENRILDELLYYMKDTKYDTFSLIKNEAKSNSEFLKTIDDNILYEALNKLVKDEYVNNNYQEIGTTKGFVYKITFDGRFFSSHGGYTSEMERSQLQDKKLDEIAKTQAFQQKWIHVLTWVISIGTLVAALYYILEILKYFGVIPK